MCADAEAAAQRNDRQRTHEAADAANADEELSRQNTGAEMNFRAADRGFVDGRHGGGAPSNSVSPWPQQMAPRCGACQSRSRVRALDGAQRTRRKMRVPDAANP